MEAIFDVKHPCNNNGKHRPGWHLACISFDLCAKTGALPANGQGTRDTIRLIEGARRRQKWHKNVGIGTVRGVPSLAELMEICWKVESAEVR